MVDTVTVHLRFGVDTELGPFQDTLVFSEDEWAKRDDTTIAAAKKDLADTYVTFRSAQLAEERALATKEGRDAKIAEYEVKIAALQEAIDSLKVA